MVRIPRRLPFRFNVLNGLISSLKCVTSSILVENKFGALARIAGMFSGRGFNIETLNVGPMVDHKLSRITATIIEIVSH